MGTDNDEGATRPGVPLPTRARDSQASTAIHQRRRPHGDGFYTLRVVAGRDMLRFVTVLPGEEIGIGRDEEGGLVLSDASVSRRHARVICQDDGSVLVEDLGSTNGTAVNGQPVQRAILQTGAHLEIGAVALRLEHLSLEEVRHLASVIARLESANRDPLTGLHTRAWIEDELPTLLEACGRSGGDCSVVFADIDNFKTINDRYGHQVGDDVLVGVARLLLVGVRETDTCVRYGGEEMLMFLQGSSEAVAYEVAERMRRLIETHDWARTVPGLRVTASFGVAGACAGETAKEWINRADRALYAAKTAGRNRTVRAVSLR